MGSALHWRSVSCGAHGSTASGAVRWLVLTSPVLEFVSTFRATRQSFSWQQDPTAWYRCQQRACVRVTCWMVCVKTRSHMCSTEVCLALGAATAAHCGRGLARKRLPTQRHLSVASQWFAFLRLTWVQDASLLSNTQHTDTTTVNTSGGEPHQRRDRARCGRAPGAKTPIALLHRAILDVMRSSAVSAGLGSRGRGGTLHVGRSQTAKHVEQSTFPGPSQQGCGEEGEKGARSVGRHPMLPSSPCQAGNGGQAQEHQVHVIRWRSVVSTLVPFGPRGARSRPVITCS